MRPLHVASRPKGRTLIVHVSHGVAAAFHAYVASLPSRAHCIGTRSAISLPTG
jgi:hypothetical protein